MRRMALLHTLWFGIVSTLVVLGLTSGLDQVTHTVAGDGVALMYFGLYGLYCLQNYRGCREYHCMITGPGFILAAALMLLRVTDLFDHGFGIPYIVFGLAAVIGHGLEWRYGNTRGVDFALPDSVWGRVGTSGVCFRSDGLSKGCLQATPPCRGKVHTDIRKENT